MKSLAKALLSRSRFFRKYTQVQRFFDSQVKEIYWRLATYTPSKRILNPQSEINFGIHGGTECFFFDVNGDGQLEIITYQGPGVFGASTFRNKPKIGSFLPPSVSVSAFGFNGTRLWTWGEPNPAGKLYLSHAYEYCLDCADIDGDGARELILADGCRIVVLDGKSGRQKRTCALPDDNYYVLKALDDCVKTEEAALVVKNGEDGYGFWPYGQPVLGLNADLEIVWGPLNVPGGGHSILTWDVNRDGKKEYLIGYCALTPGGKILWTVDEIDPRTLDADAMHVDDIAIADDGSGKTFLAIAGSDKFYVIDAEGRCLFRREDSHPQEVLIGRVLLDSKIQAVCYNAPDGPLILYDLSGRRLRSIPVHRMWPSRRFRHLEKYRYHRNRPIAMLSGEKPRIAFADGGWPWAVNGEGKQDVVFRPPEHLVPPVANENLASFCRGDDLGLSFGLQCADVDQDGRDEVLIYNRNALWIYKLD